MKLRYLAPAFLLLGLAAAHAAEPAAGPAMQPSDKMMMKDDKAKDGKMEKMDKMEPSGKAMSPAEGSMTKPDGKMTK